MMIIRPVEMNDLESLLKLTEQTTFGLTTLPKDRDYLEKRICQSIAGFQTLHQQPAGEAYLFVMHNLETNQVVGTTGIVSKVGGFEPFYTFKIETSIHESQQLNIRKEIQTLHLIKNHDGPCEIGSLFLSPEGRGVGHGRLLSLSRFLFMAEFPKYFDQQVIAELRGVIDERGHSDFWDAVGKHFFEIDFPTADYLSILNKQFIAELLPIHPIYIPLLPPAAQKVIAQVHPNTEPALKMLQDEGFTKNDTVDIFEAGPTLESPRTNIRAVRDSKKLPILNLTDSPPQSPLYVISNTSRDFHAALGQINIKPEGVIITKQLAVALNVQQGDSIRFVATKPNQP